LHYFI